MFKKNFEIISSGEIRQAGAELLADMQEQETKPDAATIMTVVIICELLERKFFGGGRL